MGRAILFKKLDETRYKELVDLDTTQIKQTIISNDKKIICDYITEIESYGSLNELYYNFIVDDIRRKNQDEIRKNMDKFINVLFHEYFLNISNLKDEIVDYFIEKNISFFEKVKGKTLLQKAVLQKRYDLIDYLIKKIEVEITIDDFKLAVLNNNIKLIEIFSQKFEDINFYSKEQKLRTRLSFFEFAVKIGHSDAINLLFNKYKDSISQESLNKAIHIALESPLRVINDNNLELINSNKNIELLLNYGANIHYKFEFNAMNLDEDDRSKNNEITAFTRAINKYQNSFDSDVRNVVYKSLKVIIENNAKENFKEDEVYEKYFMILSGHNLAYNSKINELIKYFREIRAVNYLYNDIKNIQPLTQNIIQNKFKEIFFDQYDFYANKVGRGLQYHYHDNINLDKYYNFFLDKLNELNLNKNQYNLYSSALALTVKEIEKYFSYRKMDKENKIEEIINNYKKKCLDLGGEYLGIDDGKAIKDIYRINHIDNDENREKLLKIIHESLLKASNNNLDVVDWTNQNVQNMAYIFKYAIEKHLEQNQGTFDLSNVKNIFSNVYSS